MSYAVALEALRDLVVSLSGVADTLVLLAYGDLGRPSSPHMTIQEVADLDVGWAQRTALDTVGQERQARLQIDAYGASAVDALRKTATLLRSSDARILATSMAIQGVGNVRNTTAIWMTKYEPRATLEVLMGYAVSYTASDPTTATSIGLAINATIQGSAAYDRAPGYDAGTYSALLTIELPNAAP